MSAADAAAAVEKPIVDWFGARGWRPLDVQRDAWRAYLAGRSGLIHAPTGTGKTLAAALGPLAEAVAESAAAAFAEPDGVAPPITLLWVTPLRALAGDTEISLREPLQTLCPRWTVGRRTGDTGSAARGRQRRRLPTLLITTPESLSLLLSYADTQRQLATLRAVVVDEWHELLGTKRGVQLELCLSRLRALSPGLRRWGLSATLGNLDEALDALLGADHDGVIVGAAATKTLRIDALYPDRLERFPWAGSLGLKLLPQVAEGLPDDGSTLLFCNSRAQAELWYHGLALLRPQWADAGLLELHHSAVARPRREQIEQALKGGRLRCVVCTSSLDLGVDFAPVDNVVQIGSAKGVARLAQRAGRSGHGPGRPSRVLCVPTHALELIEIAAARAALARGAVERRRPLRLSLDVLVQHLITLALGGGFDAGPTLYQVRSSHAFAELDDADWRWALDFISRGGDALQHYPQYQKARVDDGRYIVDDRRIARMHRLSIGTIDSNSLMQVKFLRGGHLGNVEEQFIARLQPGDRFLFAGRLLTLSRVKDMTAYVRLAKGAGQRTPRWTGSRLPFTELLAGEVLTLLTAYPQVPEHAPELAALAPILDLQRRWSALPGDDALLVERVDSREGAHLLCYPFAGRAVHQGLAALLAYRLSRRRPVTFSISVNDYGFELLSATSFEIDEHRLGAELTAQGFDADLRAALNLAELAKRQFRDIARIAGLIFRGYPGRDKSSRQLQASSGMIYEVLKDFDPGNRLLRLAEREALDQQLDAGRLRALLTTLAGRPIRLCRPPRLTPLAFPLWAERTQFQISSESWRQRVQRMALRLERAAPNG